MVTFDVALFRVQFPEFADAAAYPDAVLEACFMTAECFVLNESNPCLSDACLLLVLHALTAHICKLNDLNTNGGAVGIVTSASVGSVSVTAAEYPFGSDAWKYWMGLTVYGQQAMAILSGAAAGGLYFGGSPERSGFRRVGGGFGGTRSF